MPLQIPNRQAKVQKIPDTLGATLSAMRDLMIAGSTEPFLLELTGRIVNNEAVRPGLFNDPLTYDIARLRAIYTWIRQNISYVHDGFDASVNDKGEIVRDVEVILRGRAGDCDDITVLVGAMLLATFEGYTAPNGRNYSPIEVWLFGRDGAPFHVFPVAVLFNGQKIVMDAAAMAGSSFGALPGAGDGKDQYWPVAMFGPVLS